jgi:hypothetical protein
MKTSAQVKAARDGQAWLMGLENLDRAYGPGEPLLVELPGIESGTDFALMS